MRKLCLFLNFHERSEVVVLDSSCFAFSVCCCGARSIYRALKALVAIAAKRSSGLYRSPGVVKHFTLAMAWVKPLDSAFSNALPSDMATTWKTFMRVRSGCLPWLVSSVWLALEKNNSSGFTKTRESTSCLCFVFFCLAQHVFACLTVCCWAGKVGQIVCCVKCSDFWLSVNNKGWYYSWSNCFHCENISMSFRQPTRGGTMLWSTTLHTDF